MGFFDLFVSPFVEFFPVDLAVDVVSVVGEELLVSVELTASVSDGNELVEFPVSVDEVSVGSPVSDVDVSVGSLVSDEDASAGLLESDDDSSIGVPVSDEDVSPELLSSGDDVPPALSSTDDVSGDDSDEESLSSDVEFELGVLHFSPVPSRTTRANVPNFPEAVPDPW